MSEIGAKLKEQRMAKGLSIEDVQNATKIRSWYIEAIEEGKFEKLPGKFYEKSFIQSYADLVELDSEIYQQYLNENEPIKLGEQLEKSETYKPKSTVFHSVRDLFRKPLFYVLLLLIVIVFYIGITILTDGDNNNSNQFTNRPPSQGQEEPQGVVPDNNDDGNDITDSTIVINMLEGTVLNQEVYQIVSENNELYLDFELTGPSWISIKEESADGRELFVQTLTPQVEFEKIKLDRTLYLHIGNARNIDILINDEKIELGDEKVVKRVTLKREE